ncbi:purine-cytosine permease family protein [Amycolatopsis jejuensis]|uniref:purine-cytosine permease family protein n=1 Tax=Amycolatopsis jejuensis TaxID=330084 RepID=UPI0005249E07|nr:cytosine permease [Amycolatopsis jejuensis]
MKIVKGVDDYSSARVPTAARYSWRSLAVQRFGQNSALIVVIFGAELGTHLTFWKAMLAILVGMLLFEIVAVGVGIIGMREGMPTYALARWTGFGTGGSSVISLVIGLSMIGWFGIQTGIAAQGLTAIVGGLPMWLWAVVCGLVVTLISFKGIRSMAWTAYIAVPAFLIVIAWSIGTELARHDLTELLRSAPPSTSLTMLQAIAIASGPGVVQALISPDMTRFNRSAADVVKQTVVGISLGGLVLGGCGVLLAHAARTSNINAIVLSSVGWVGVVIIVAGTVKVNDWNLYSSGLSVMNFVQSVFGRRLHRWTVTAALGIAGTVVAAVGVLSQFLGFLTLLGVAMPPITGIMIAEYFFVRRWRADLESSRASGQLPAHAPAWVPASLVIWVLSSVAGAVIPVGISSLNALVLAMVLYVLAAKLGWVRGFGGTRAEPAVKAVGQPVEQP